MKLFSLLLLLFFGQSYFAQTYVFDSTFGDAGSIQHPVDFRPYKGCLVDGNYLFLSGRKIAKVDYNGQFVSDFGVNGIYTITNDETIYFTDLIHENNTTYIFGRKTNSSTNTDIVIGKLDTNNLPDTSFGNNGIATIDFGPSDYLSNFIVLPDGTLFCTSYKDPKTIYFKLTPTGAVDLTFDALGYKQLATDEYQYCFSGGVVEYESGYLLTGVVPVADGYTRLLLAKIDANGIIDTTFGTNGYRLIPLEAGIGTNTIDNVAFSGNKLYVNHYYAFSSNNRSPYLMIYNIDTNQVVYDSPQMQNFDFTLENDNVLYTGWLSTCTQVSTCGNSFTVRKRLPNGSPDASFHNAGIYNYRFPVFSLVQIAVLTAL